MVALGGGHGLASTLRAVRSYAGGVAAIVSVADDGGSSGRLRQIAGIPRPATCAAAWSPWAPPGRPGPRLSSTASPPATSKGTHSGTWSSRAWPT